MFFLYISFLFVILADQVQLVVGVIATARAADMSVPSSDAASNNGRESPASAEDEEEDELLDTGTNQPQATIGFLPPTATIQKTVAAMAAAPQQTTKVPQHQPEVLFHFSPPRQRKQSPSDATTHVRHPASLPSAVAVAAIQVSEPQAGTMSSASGKPKMGLASTIVHLEDSKPKVPWPPKMNEYETCDPPCIQGRGVCNDKVCFCKDPFVGSTCQKKTLGATMAYRASRMMVIGVAVVCAIFGFLSARLANVFFQGRSEHRLQRYGQGKVKIERWAPPPEAKGSGAGAG